MSPRLQTLLDQVRSGWVIGSALFAVCILVFQASGLFGLPTTVRTHDVRMAVSDSAIIAELRKQTCILVADNGQEKHDCLKHFYDRP